MIMVDTVHNMYRNLLYMLWTVARDLHQVIICFRKKCNISKWTCLFFKLTINSFNLLLYSSLNDF